MSTSTTSLPPLVEPAAPAESRRGGPLQPSSDHSRPGRRRAEAAQERAGAGDRCRRARRTGVAVSGRGRRRHDRHRRLRRRRRVEPAAPDHPRRGRRRTVQGPVGARLDRRRSTRWSTCDCTSSGWSASNAVDLFEQYDLILDGTDNFATRYLVNDAAVLAEKAVRVGVDLPLRGPGLGVLGGRSRRARPQLPRPVPGAAAARHGAVVRRRRRAGHHLCLHRVGDGHRGDQADHRDRRIAAGPVDDLRRAGDELPHHQRSARTRRRRRSPS